MEEAMWASASGHRCGSARAGPPMRPRRGRAGGRPRRPRRRPPFTPFDDGAAGVVVGSLVLLGEERPRARLLCLAAGEAEVELLDRVRAGPRPALEGHHLR